jgi:hypothetical protein
VNVAGGLHVANRNHPSVILCPPEALLLGPHRPEGWTGDAVQWQVGCLIYFAATGEDLLAVRGMVDACVGSWWVENQGESLLGWDRHWHATL